MTRKERVVSLDRKKIVFRFGKLRGPFGLWSGLRFLDGKVPTSREITEADIVNAHLRIARGIEECIRKIVGSSGEISFRRESFTKSIVKIGGIREQIVKVFTTKAKNLPINEDAHLTCVDYGEAIICFVALHADEIKDHLAGLKIVEANFGLVTKEERKRNLKDVS